MIVLFVRHVHLQKSAGEVAATPRAKRRREMSCASMSAELSGVES